MIRNAGGSTLIGANSPDNPIIGYRISVPTGCAKRAVGTTLAIRNPRDTMHSVEYRSANPNETTGAWMPGGKYRRPTRTIRTSVNAVNSSFTITCAVRIVCDRSGVARRRFRMPPSR